MALTVINGLRDTVGTLGSKYYGEKLKDFILTLKAGNTTLERGVIPVASFFNSKTKQVDRVPGQPIPVENYNVFFTPGGLTDNGMGFSKYVEKFIMPMDRGLTALTYKFTHDEILKARENGIDLSEQVTESIMAFTNLYQGSIIPYKQINTVLTGASLSPSCPDERDGGNYAGQFGWLRGEDVSNYKKGHIQMEKANHYRGTKGVTFALSDVDDCVDLLKAYKDASMTKPFALANSRTIRNTIGSVLEASTNRDELLVQGAVIKYAEAMGCRWIDMDSYLPDGIILFIDGEEKDLIIKSISPDKEQRGIAFVKDFNTEAIKLENAEDLAGGTVHVFPEEQVIAKRHKGVILDTLNQGKTESGKEGWATETTINKINDFCKNLVSVYLKPMK